MKYLLSMILCVLFVACSQNQQGKPDLKDQKDSLSYSIGLNIGKDLKSQSIEVDPDLISAGIRHSTIGDTVYLTDEQINAVLMKLQSDVDARRKEEQSKLAEKNRTEGKKFLEENKSKEGVIILPSGLQYKILQEGTGKTPKATDMVTTHYRGTLIDGKEFDSSFKRGQPATFPVSGVIPGWTEALQLMKVGSKWQLFIPPDLAYGAHGAGADIGPDATLIFEIELLDIKEQK